MAYDPTGSIDPDRILDRTFPTVRRGVDPGEVERYLLQIAGQMRTMAARITQLEREADLRPARGESRDAVDPGDLSRLVGEETARVLDAAQAAAAEIRARAEENVARMLHDARDEALRAREDSESLVARRTAEAEAAATEVRNRLEIDLARAEADAIAIIDDAKQRGREMLAEAQQVRQRMLDDLARRRQGLREQIEQLQASRDRLLAAYDVVRDTLTVATEELHEALPDSRIAAESASLRAVEAELEATIPPVVPIVTAEDATQSHPAVVDDPPAEPPRLTVVPPVVEATPEPDRAAVESVRVLESVPEPAPPVASAPEPEPEPEPELQSEPSGRHSSSVRVVRTGKAADVFARLREEGAAEAEAEAGGRRARSVTAVPDAPADAPADTAATDAATPPRTKRSRSATDVETGPQAAAPVEEPLVEPPSEADEQAFVTTRDEAIASISASLTRRIKRELSDEQNELLATVGTIKGNRSAITLLPLPEAQLERFENLALPPLADAAAAGAALAPKTGRGSAFTSVGDLASELASEVVIPLRDRIERAVSEASGDRDDLSKLVRAAYREWKGARVDDAVEFAVRAACNRGMLDRMPRGTKVRWVVALGDQPSPDCEDNALAGAVVIGQPFPTGHLAPPLHPGCHCVVLPAEH